jgi:hypothetical protein
MTDQLRSYRNIVNAKSIHKLKSTEACKIVRVKAMMRTIYTMAKELIPTRKIHALAELQALNVSLL